MFGGYSASGAALNDTWVWDGKQWSQKSPATSPSARLHHAMAFDAARGQVVLFGGQTSLVGFVTYLNDTWTWDGSNWTLMSPAHSPAVRGNLGLAYDSANAKVVLYAGCNNSTSWSDTWTWDGNDWTAQTPSSNPGARNSHMMVYDSAHGQVVVFGGTNGQVGSSLLNDTWTWDGSNWTQFKGSTPPGRMLAGMAYDSTQKKTVLFGGMPNFTSMLSDTWLWDGSSWTQITPPTSPSARHDHTMAYDSARGQTLLFGGNLTASSSTVSADTWLFAAAAATPVIAGVQSAGAFGAFPTIAPGTWIEIFGSNLAASTRLWASDDFSGNNAPTKLDNVSVTIAGIPAFIDFIRADQVNVQVPAGVPSGPQQLILTNGDAHSQPFTVNVNDTQPGLLAPPSFKLNGNQYVVATVSDGAAYILPSGSIAGVNSRPVKPGETITIYGVGFGAVAPNIPAGQIAHESNQLALTFQVKIGSAPAQLSYFGLAPNYVGLYQFNVVVPDVPDNDLVPLTFTLNGTAGTPTLYLAVHH